MIKDQGSASFIVPYKLEGVCVGTIVKIESASGDF
jgi:hypothetical protein